MIKQIALKPMRYGTRRLQAGDEFEAEDRYATIFRYTKMARDADEDQSAPPVKRKRGRPPKVRTEAQPPEQLSEQPPLPTEPEIQSVVSSDDDPGN